ncbi:MAG: hypothetical protein V1783_09390 [Bacteroidota bacterium]|jgi:hypothetical protein
MKKYRNIFFIIGLLILTACERTYFSVPQPVDSKNIYEFPKEIRGLWVNNFDTIVIGSTQFKSLEYKEFKVEKSIADTSSSYIFRNGKVFLVNNDKSLSERLNYSIVNDTVVILKREVQEISLSQNSFLRAIDFGYILNIKNEEHWWELYLIEPNVNGRIIVTSLKHDNLDVRFNEEILHKKESTYYLNVKWTKNDLSQIINNGIFCDTLLQLEINEKINKFKH